MAVEIGSLGDNIRFLRRAHRRRRDSACARAASRLQFHTVNAHTRWASVGAITEANCHPVDNQAVNGAAGETGIIHTCLNGDIDNFQELKEAFERNGRRIHAEVTTDTKIIPLQIEHYLRQGFDVAEAFRRAVSDFKGSHAIAMHTDLAPGKLFLAQQRQRPGDLRRHRPRPLHVHLGGLRVHRGDPGLHQARRRVGRGRHAAARPRARSSSWTSARPAAWRASPPCATTGPRAADRPAASSAPPSPRATSTARTTRTIS
ncbi:MAG: hypothetical protein MZV70_50815 [Desulfobacterales bacterium]|nr:hypothetical protein [Desulfobacterales bacterium]